MVRSVAVLAVIAASGWFWGCAAIGVYAWRRDQALFAAAFMLAVGLVPLVAVVNWLTA